MRIYLRITAHIDLLEECAIYKGEEVIDQLEIADARSEDLDDCLKVQLWIIR